MNWYPAIQNYYKEDRYTADDLQVFLRAGWMTPEQYKELTGEEPPTAWNRSVAFLKRTFLRNDKTS